MSAISRAFLDLPELRPYFYDSEDASDLRGKNLILHLRVEAMCEMLFDHAEVVLEQPKTMGPLGESYEQYFCDLVRSSPALRTYWQKRRQWYVPRLQTFFDEVVNETLLTSAAPKPLGAGMPTDLTTEPSGSDCVPEPTNGRKEQAL
jgi:hypothetical protein